MKRTPRTAELTPQASRLLTELKKLTRLPKRILVERAIDAYYREQNKTAKR